MDANTQSLMDMSALRLRMRVKLSGWLGKMKTLDYASAIKKRSVKHEHIENSFSCSDGDRSIRKPDRKPYHKRRLCCQYSMDRCGNSVHRTIAEKYGVKYEHSNIADHLHGRDLYNRSYSRTGVKEVGL